MDQAYGEPLQPSTKYEDGSKPRMEEPEGSGVPHNATPASATFEINHAEARQRRYSISMPTFISGMFLTLVLGVYIGTLIPDILEGKKQPATISQAPAPSASKEPAPGPSSQPNAETTAKTPAKAAPASIPNDLLERISTISRRVAQNPGDAHLWSELGDLYFDTNQPSLAVNAYEKSLAIEPANADVLTDLGIMYREMENFTKAIECFRMAAKINPKHQNSLYNEGIVLSTDMHNNPQAIEAWTRLLEINPGARAPDGTPVSELIKKLR